jgi:hypothetical protein
MKAIASFVSIGALLGAQETVPQHVAASNLRAPLRCNGARHKVKPLQFQIRILLALVLLLALGGVRAHAYSLLTHEELIDLNWQYSIVPLWPSQPPHFGNLSIRLLDRSASGSWNSLEE